MTSLNSNLLLCEVEIIVLLSSYLLTLLYNLNYHILWSLASMVITIVRVYFKEGGHLCSFTAFKKLYCYPFIKYLQSMEVKTLEQRPVLKLTLF